jgi:hypothetical protein
MNMGTKHLTTYRNKPSVFDRIESGEISEDEKNSIMDEFEKHLNSPYGTLENYPKRYVVEALLKKYETVADPREIQQFTRLKIGRLLNNSRSRCKLPKKRLRTASESATSFGT